MGTENTIYTRHVIHSREKVRKKVTENKKNIEAIIVCPTYYS